MSLVKKPRSGSAVKSTDKKAVIITKTKSTDKTSFSKKVKAMNTLLAKATLL